MNANVRAYFPIALVALLCLAAGLAMGSLLAGCGSLDLQADPYGGAVLVDTTTGEAVASSAGAQTVMTAVGAAVGQPWIGMIGLGLGAAGAAAVAGRKTKA